MFFLGVFVRRSKSKDIFVNVDVIESDAAEKAREKLCVTALRTLDFYPGSAITNAQIFNMPNHVFDALIEEISGNQYMETINNIDPNDVDYRIRNANREGFNAGLNAAMNIIARYKTES